MDKEGVRRCSSLMELYFIHWFKLLKWLYVSLVFISKLFGSEASLMKVWATDVIEDKVILSEILLLNLLNDVHQRRVSLSIFGDFLG